MSGTKEDEQDPEHAMSRANPAVPTNLLEIHLAIEEAGMTPEEFKKARFK